MGRILTLATSVAIFLAAGAIGFGSQAEGQPYGWGMGWGMMDGWSGGGWGWFGALHMIVWLLILVLIVAGIVWLARAAMQRGDSDRTRSSSALAVLDERYARGDIDRDEYLEKKRVILG